VGEYLILQESVPQDGGVQTEGNILGLIPTKHTHTHTYGRKKMDFKKKAILFSKITWARKNSHLLFTEPCIA
jgi:hypothetical protein